MIEIVITENEQNQRLDRFLRKFLPKAPLGHIYKIIRKDVKVNGRRATLESMLRSGDVLTLYMSQDDFEEYSKKQQAATAKMQFSIAYEDENLLIVDKPRGLLTHGDKAEKKNTLINQVTGYLSSKGEYDIEKEKTFAPAAVNRLDRNTSGLVMFGKNYRSVQVLNQMVKTHESIRKLYLAACFGEIKGELHLESTMKKEEDKNRVRLESGVGGEGKVIKTIVRPVEVKDGYSLVEAELLTGRTHQIRAHLAQQGFPIIADPKYGDLKKNRAFYERFGINTQFLHAYKLIFGHCPEPFSYMEKKVISVQLPKKLKDCWEQL